MDSSKIKVIIIAILAMFAALYLGIAAATAQLEAIAWILGGFTLVTCILLGTRIWLLLPLLGSMMLELRLPGNPTSLLLAQFLCLGFSIPLFLLRRLPYRFRFTALDFWVLVVLASVLQVYMRNPTGLSIFGTDTVGGRAYFIFLISLATYLLLSGLNVKERDLARMYWLSIVGGLSNFVLFAFGNYFPSIGLWYGAAYDSTADTSASSGIETGNAGRINFLINPARSLSLWLTTQISPLKALLRPLWLLVLVLSLAFAAMSGFRNVIAGVVLTLLVGLLYRGGFLQFLISSLAGVAAIALLAGVNVISPLPANAQRALSFLPGTWEERYVFEATKSTEWRVEIWKEVLLTDRWIFNKILGDGLGFSKKELALQMSLMDSKNAGAGHGVSGFDSHREAILANGDYHSGPVQTIRTIGYVGLFFFLCAMLRLAVHAHRQIQRCRNTNWFPLALLIGIPLVWAPIYFVFVFGTFQAATSAFFMGAGFVRLLENNLPLPPWRSRRA